MIKIISQELIKILKNISTIDNDTNTVTWRNIIIANRHYKITEVVITQINQYDYSQSVTLIPNIPGVDSLQSRTDYL